MNEKSSAHSEKVVLPLTPLAANISSPQGKAEIVDSLLHPAVILVHQLLTRSGRLEHNMILIDDEENIMQAVEAGVEIHSLYYSGVEALSPQLMRKLPFQIRVYELAQRTCKKLFANDKVSRVFAIAHMPATRHLSSVEDSPRDIVALEDLTISGNIGSIVRTAVAFGGGGIILLNADPVDIYDRRLIRASRGHIFSLPVIAVTTDEFIRFCRENGFALVIMAAQADQLVQEAEYLPNRLAIVFGSEKDGCSPTLRAAATLRVQIPTSSRVESLNVSTAAGIMLYKRAWFNRSK
jgi:23S rRNA (adenosine1067-2'-O)-methyltransferase